MIRHLWETWKIENKVTYISIIYLIIFINRYIKIFSWSFSIKPSKINRMDRKVERYSWPEKHYEPIQQN